MNVGELKLTPKFFNSQGQLNNDWFLNENKSEFENILKEKTVKCSDVQDTKLMDVKEKTSEKSHEVVKKAMQKTEQKLGDKDLKEVTSKINEAIKKNKFEKENGDGDLSLKELEEKIEALEEQIMAEMGIVEEQPILEEIAQLMGISVEALVEQLTSEGDKEAVIAELVSLVENEEIDSKQLVQALRQVFNKLDASEKIEFEKVVEDLIEKLPQGDVKEAVQKFDDVLENVIKRSGEGQEVEAQVAAEPAKEVTTQTQTQTTPQVNETETVEKPVEVQTDSQQTDQDASKSNAEPMMNAEIKVSSQEVEQKFNVEEQINMMKAESSVISGGKETPKAMLSRSVMNQVVQGTKMSINMSDQGSEILIKLNPKNLGNVALKMAFEKGTLLAQIQVENQTVKGIIESNLDDLKSALQQEGYEIGDLDVSVNKENTGEGQQGFTGQNKKQFVKFESFEEVEEKILQQKASQEGIDYLA
ncbi:hypothetical protein EZV73_14105 [Acidaminobacter sp. JC074]|uniref:flagellar hook-length control protein FliK n=1 Tax=Acidaminobacter sp. JC074 TaxID=2530199 RepID=UPI001F0D2FAD|nr:flagellar hook-length control protein FliK [Acidaminobacter sp. JC074]MCH4888723.1 hypothetical protein [Acidaminobacter sp. JC074]